MKEKVWRLYFIRCVKKLVWFGRCAEYRQHARKSKKMRAGTLVSRGKSSVCAEIQEDARRNARVAR